MASAEKVGSMRKTATAPTPSSMSVMAEKTALLCHSTVITGVAGGASSSSAMVWVALPAVPLTL